MDYSDNSYVPTSWAVLSTDPFQDPRADCLQCQPFKNPSNGAAAPQYGDVAAPPPGPGVRPCPQCPALPTFPQRLIARDLGPPCCTTETYRYNTGKWPWQYGSFTAGVINSVETPSPPNPPELFQDLYAVKNRARSGFKYDPIFNPYVL